MSLLDHEVTHALLSIAAGVVTYFLLRKGKITTRRKIFLGLIGGFLGEFFLDADHLIDYFVTFGSVFHPATFFAGKMFLVSGRTIVPFHSWEIVVVLAIIIYFLRNASWKFFLTAVTTGIFFHLAYDMVFNHVTFLGYSLTYRITHGFVAKYFTSLPD